MHRFRISLLACCCLLATAIHARAADQLLTQPGLAPYGLTRGWFAQAPAGSDGFRVLDAQYHTGELFVLTEAGSLTCFDATTGLRKWIIRVGDSRNNYLPMGVGTNAVGVICGTRLYAVGRKDMKIIDTSTDYKPATPTKKGAAESIRYRTIPMVGKQIFEVKTEYVPSAPPALSETTAFMPNLTGMLDRYDLKYEASVRYLGAIQTDGLTNTRPVVTGLGVGWISETGTVGLATPTGEKTYYTYRVRGAGKVSPAAHGNTLYAATELGQISQFTGERGEPKWTASIGVGAKTQPVIVDKALYVVGNDFRLFKLNTVDGRELWQTPGVRQFLAQSKTHVYVIDEMRRMAILDIETGSLKAAIALPEYEFPIANPHSDQIFFVTKHGLVQELHETALKERIDYYVAPGPRVDATKKPPKPVVPAVDPAAPGADPFSPAAPAAPAGGDPFAPAPATPAPTTPAPGAAADPFAPAPAGGAMPAPAPAMDPFAK